MAGIVISGRQLDLLAVLGDLLDEGFLRLAGQQAQVGLLRHGDAVGLQRPQQGADPGVGILHIVNGVLGILPDSQSQIKLHLGVRLGVEIPPGSVHRHLIQQIVEGNGLARPLGHTDHLAIPQQLYQLHQHNIQPPGAVEAQRVQRALQPGHVTVVVGAPDVDNLVKAPDGKLVAVIGNIRSKIGVEAVGPAKHVVLEIQLLDVLFLLALLAEVIPEDLRGFQPQSAVLFISPALFRQEIHRLRHIAALMERGLVEPVVIADLVTLQIRLHPGQVHGKAILGQRVLPLLFGDVQEALAVFLVISLRQILDIPALIAVLREGDGVLAIDELEIAHLNGAGKLVDLVSGVVNIEFPRHVRTAGRQDGSQRIPQHAAAGIAHVHRACGVGGDKLHHDLLTRQAVVGTVGVPFRFHSVHNAGVPRVPQPEIQEAGACDLRRGKIAIRQIHVIQQSLCNDAGRLAQRLGRRQSKGGGVVAVCSILGDLHRGGLYLRRRQRTVRRGRLIGRHGQRRRLVLRVLDHVRHIVKPFLRLKIVFIFSAPGS